MKYRKSYRRCGKPNCATCAQGPGHGPYWYGSWREGMRVRTIYVGKRPPCLEKPAELRVQTLARFAVWQRGGEPAHCRGRPQELFTMLLSAPLGRVGREEAAETLWPEQDPMVAHQNLRSTVGGLRRQLGGPEYISVQGPSLSLALPPGCRDDETFESAARGALREADGQLLETAVDCYTGPYLPEDLYADWTTYRRQILSDLHRELIFRLVAANAAPPLKRVELLRRLLAVDGCDEQAAALLIRALLSAGRRPEAFRVLNGLRESLASELEIEPEPETLSLLA